MSSEVYIDPLNTLYDEIEKGNLYTVKKWFIDYKLSDFSYNNWSPVHEAVYQGQAEILWHLINNYACHVNEDFELEPSYDEVYGAGNFVKDQNDITKGSALTLALQTGNLACADLLIRAGAYVNESFLGSISNKYRDIRAFFGNNDTDEGNCLMLALKIKASPIVKLMHENGLLVDDSWSDNYGKCNAFNYFLSSGMVDQVRQLLELGADPHQIINDEYCDWNALYFVVSKYRSTKESCWLEMASLLVHHGANLAFRETDGEDDTVLEMVIRAKDFDLAKIFGVERLITHE